MNQMSDDKRPVGVPQLKAMATSRPVMFHLVPVERDFGWAYAIASNEEGVVAIVSDWGSWSYVFTPTPSNLGAESLMHFLGGRANAHYLANKLCPRAQRRRFSAEQTVKAWKTGLAKARLICGRFSYGRSLGRDQARAIWDALDDLRGEQSADLFLVDVDRIEGMEFIGYDLWDNLEYEDAIEYQVLRHAIIPALQQACRDYLAEQEA